MYASLNGGLISRAGHAFLEYFMCFTFPVFIIKKLFKTKQINRTKNARGKKVQHGAIQR